MSWWRKMLRLPAGPAGMLGRITASTQDPPKRGTQEHLETFEASAWPRAVGDKIANAVACCDARLYVRVQNGKKVRDANLQRAPLEVRKDMMAEAMPNLERVESHPFLDALAQPNPFMDRFGLLKITELHLDFVGDAFWLKDRNSLGAPAGFWPIPPHWVMETPTPDKQSFRVSYRSWQATIPASEIHWFHEAAPANPYTRGTGIGWALADEVQVDEYAAKMAAAFFFNRARPDFVFATGLGDEETKRLEMDWNNRLQGFWRAHRPYFLAGTGDLPDLQKQIREFQQPTMEQLVYPNLRKVQRDIILQVWGVPPELFGILENSNRATIEAAEYLFTKWVRAPRADRLRSSLQRLFIEDYDDRGIVDVYAPVAEDKEHKLKAMQAAPWVPDVDEWRMVQGFPPLGNELGRSRMVPMNSYMTADPLDMEARPQTGGSAMRADDTKAPAVNVNLSVPETVAAKFAEALEAPVVALRQAGERQAEAAERSAQAAEKMVTQPPIVHVPAPIVNVPAPVVHVEAPIVHVPAPNVKVNVPKQGPTRTKVVSRDHLGRIEETETVPSDGVGNGR